MWKEFTQGKTGGNIININQALAHVGTMADSADALANNDVQGVNKFVNYVATQTGDPKVTNYETARQAVAEELMRTFRQVGASEKEQEQWMQRFSTAQSPDQLRGSMATAAKLLGGRIKAINDSWRRGTQSDSDFPNIVSPENQAVFARLGVKDTGLRAPLKLDANLSEADRAAARADAANPAKPIGPILDMKKEISDAQAAIAKGAPAEKVRALFKQKTGQDLPQ
jgi:hypothetical protein